MKRAYRVLQSDHGPRLAQQLTTLANEPLPESYRPFCDQFGGERELTIEGAFEANGWLTVICSRWQTEEEEGGTA